MNGDCQIWDGARSGRRYGGLGRGAERRLAHRVAYEQAHGPIPAGLEIDHLCRNPLCVNPDHLEAVTHRENVLRGVGPTALNARKTHCKRGHEFSPENTYRDPAGGRRCRQCARDGKAAA